MSVGKLNESLYEKSLEEVNNRLESRLVGLWCYLSNNDEPSVDYLKREIENILGFDVKERIKELKEEGV